MGNAQIRDHQNTKLSSSTYHMDSRIPNFSDFLLGAVHILNRLKIKDSEFGIHETM